MKTVGIVAEYNPFHAGHRKQFDRVKAEFGGETAIVCAMSGNYVQRGEPAVFDKGVRARAAVDATRNRKIGIIGTAATVRSGSYAATIRDMMPDVQIFARACPMFVPLVENGYFNDGNPVTKLIIAEYLQELKDAGVDTLILGCTHYPLLKKMIGDFMGDEVHLVDSGKVTAQAAAAALDDLGLLNGKKTGGTARYFVSDTPDNFDELAHTFLGEYAGGTVERIAIETY